MNETEELIMKRTEILCPECMKKKVLQETKTKCYCDNCGTRFILIAPNTLKYE